MVFALVAWLVEVRSSLERVVCAFLALVALVKILERAVFVLLK